MDSRYPGMFDWAKAGVQGDLPRQSKVIARARPGADLQQLIDSAPEAGGVILLSAGKFPLTKPLQMRSHVILRGLDAAKTWLVIKIRAPKPSAAEIQEKALPVSAIQFDGTQYAGLELLGVLYDSGLQANPPAGDNLDDLHVTSVSFKDASDCWITHCTILNSGSHPLIAEGSQHLSFVNVDIKGALNRGADSGQVKIRRSTYILFNYVTIYDINQVVFSNGTPEQPCRFNVVVKCRFNVDVHFRAESSGGNLLENCVVAIPGSHERPPLSQDRGSSAPVNWDERNFIYNCTITRDFPAASRVFSMADDPQKVYVLSDNIRETAISIIGPAPLSNTLWPVR